MSTRAALAALAALVLTVSIAPLSNNDVFLHLTTGRTVLATGSVPRVDDYSALARGRPYVAHEWLSGVLFRAVEIGVGLDGLVALKAIVALAVAGVLYAAARVAGAAPAVAVPVVSFAMLLAGARIMERPHLFTYLLAALFVWRLACRRTRGAALWPLLPLQVLWANLHAGFVLGPAIVALAAAAAALEGARAAATGGEGAPRSARLAEARRLALLAAALVAACLVNPYGIDLLKFPFALTGSAFMGEIYEWLPPYSPAYAGSAMFRLYVAWTILGGGALAGAALLVRRRREPPPGGWLPLLLFGGLFALSLRMNRNVTDFALLTAPGVSAAATTLLRPRGKAALERLLPVVSLLIVAVALWLAFAGYPYGNGRRRATGFGIGANIPVGAADWIEARGVRGNLFNTYAAGAYLVYRLYPDVRVSMDSRNDVYGEALFREHRRAESDPAALAALLARLRPAALVIEWPQPGAVLTAAAIHALGGWRPVYFDDTAAVYLEAAGPYAALADREGDRWLDPSLFRPGRIAPGDAPAALREAERAVRRGHGAWIARVMRVDALLALGRRDEALAEEARLFEADPPLHHVHVLLGLVRLEGGDPAAAARRFRRALELNPASTAARDGLARAESRG